MSVTNTSYIFKIALDTPAHVMERLCASTILPGMLIEAYADTTEKVRAHSTANGPAEAMFALENSLQGEGITDAYTTGDRVTCGVFNNGDRVYCRIANGVNCAIGSKLVSNGDGYMKLYVQEASAAVVPVHPILQSEQAVDMSGSSGVDPDGFCIARVI